jgi:membrane protease YdiL (CAAX protease family)
VTEVAASAQPTASLPGGVIRSPWGVWISILWIVAAEGLRDAVDLGMDHSPLHALDQQSYLAHVLVITLSWATPLIVLVVAVRLAQWSIGEYFAFVFPRGRDIALAIAVGLALEVAGHTLAYVLGGTTSFPVEDYQAQIAAGTWAGWYLLHYWPASIYAPLVEETIYRGFLWRGLAASRLGNGGALLITSFLFAAVHYRYYIQDGTFLPGAFLSPFLSGLVFGWIRWRTGSTIAAMITHSTSNTALNIGTVMAVKLGWP